MINSHALLPTELLRNKTANKKKRGNVLLSQRETLHYNRRLRSLTSVFGWEQVGPLAIVTGTFLIGERCSLKTFESTSTYYICSLKTSQKKALHLGLMSLARSANKLSQALDLLVPVS